MANITGYNAPQNLGLRPTETGVEALAMEGRRVGLFYNQTGQDLAQMGSRLGSAVKEAGDTAVAIEDHREISHGAAQGATLIDELNQSWNDTAKNADPNDPTVAAKWREEVLKPRLQGFQQGFTTERSQEWAERFVDQYREHAFQKTAADMSRLAGDAAHVNATQTVNKLSSAVYNDPSTLPFALGALDHSVEGIVGSSPTLTADVAGSVKTEISLKGKEQIVKSAIAGAINNGGDWRKIANDPKYSGLVNGAELQQFGKAEETEQKKRRLVDKQMEVTQRQLDEQSVHRESADILTNRVSIDPQTGRPTIDPKFFQDALDIAKKYPNAPNAAETARTMINWGEAKQNEKAASPHDDPAVVDNLMKVISDPNVSTDQAKIAILKADIGTGNLTPQTRERMTQLATDLRNVNDPLLTRDLEAAKEIVEPKYSGISINPGNYAKFYYDFIHNQYTPAKVAGTLPPNALDMSDEKSMISQAIKRATGGPGASLPAAISANGGVGAAPLPVYTAPANQPKFTPPPTWQFSASRNQYRDPQGRVYNANGQPVK